MTGIDPQEFGRLQAQVQLLLDSDKAKTALLTDMSEALHATRNLEAIRVQADMGRQSVSTFASAAARN